MRLPVPLIYCHITCANQQVLRVQQVLEFPINIIVSIEVETRDPANIDFLSIVENLRSC